MRPEIRWLIALIVLLLAGAFAVAQGPQLTEVQKLQAQLQQAQEQLVQAQYALATCQAQAQAARLTQSRQQLEATWQTPGFTFDWSTLTFTPIERTPK